MQRIKKGDRASRRQFLKLFQTGTLGTFFLCSNVSSFTQRSVPRLGNPNITISLNAYSFNRPLLAGEMSLDELLEFSAGVDFDAVDLTAYYFPGYPTPPSDEYIFHIKRRALHLGLDISGTGVRTDFTAPDPEQRDANLPYIEEWLQAAQKLGAPTLRIFAGHETPAGYSRAQVTQWVVEGIKKSVTLAAKYGIVLTLQNHNNFIKTPDQLFEILREVDSEWLAVHLDIGSFRSKDPYSDIARVAPYACNWQIKENVYFEDKQVGTDLGKIVEILRDARYRGYILLETLGEGDPKIKVPRFMEELREAVSDL